MVFIGVDVQINRGCPVAVLDRAGRLVASEWLDSDAGAAGRLSSLVERLKHNGHPTWVGIDAPREPLREARVHGFRSGLWGPLKGRGLGRHCEVVVRSLGLANPQWTPLAEEAPDWMQLGFALFQAASDADRVVEVFPTATYRALAQPVRVEIDLAACAPGPKDMLDAVAAAATVMTLADGRGCEVGGGDGLGTIALPRPLTPD